MLNETNLCRYGFLPRSNNLISLAAWIPSSFRFFSICLLLALDALSSADIAQPILRQLIVSVVKIFEGLCCLVCFLLMRSFSACWIFYSFTSVFCCMMINRHLILHVLSWSTAHFNKWTGWMLRLFRVTSFVYLLDLNWDASRWIVFKVFVIL